MADYEYATTLDGDTMEAFEIAAGRSRGKRDGSGKRRKKHEKADLPFVTRFKKTQEAPRTRKAQPRGF